VVTVAEALASDQVRHRGLVHHVASPAGNGELPLLGSPAQVDGRATGPKAPPPLLGEHTEEVLREAGFTAEEIRSLRERGAV
jgi:crotonobetainyl-CoA:carnitine CoA-transferase CaiB-like acyl-CoA transferase